MDLAFAAAYARLREAHLAQDVAQEAFLQAHRDLPCCAAGEPTCA